jgi:large subunit ribosomal protein L13
MKIFDGQNAVLGRLASYAAKEALKGEEVAVLNCDLVRVSGNQANIQERFKQSRRRGGTIQRGPKISKLSYKIVKKTIRGMLPNHRIGRGREALKRIKCYSGVPPEFENSEKITFKDTKLKKFMNVEDLGK